MLKQILNECTIDITIKSEGPLLIKSGTIDVNGYDMTFVKTLRNGKNEVFIPGSSLKGLIRSYSEKIVRTLSDDAVKCCNPFNNGNEQDNSISCSQKLEWIKKGTRILPDKTKEDFNKLKKTLTTDQIYAYSCPICKLFGSTSQASRLAVEDGYLANSSKNNIQIRDGIAIDRFTGKVAEGPFDYEVSENAVFKTIIYIRNFEVWQLGLLAYTLYDFHEGLVKIGYGKSRGLGKFKAEINELKISYLSPKIIERKTPHNPELYGLKNLSSEESYLFSPNEQDAVIVKDIELSRNSDEIGLRHCYIFNKWENILALFKIIAPKFNEFLNNSWQWQDEMTYKHFTNIENNDKN